MSSGLPPGAALPAARAPLKFDLHVHSDRSFDSYAAIERILQVARERQLAGIAITDHGRSAPEDLVRAGRDAGVWIIRGNEVQSDIGDIVALFISGPLRQKKAESLIDEIHDQGGIAVLAHPFKYHGEYPDAVLKKLDAVETANSRWKDLEQHRSRPAVARLLAAVAGRSAGSDAHFPFEVGRCLWAAAGIETPDDLRQSIVNNAGYTVSCARSSWLDEASQCIKFLKRPTARQLLRIAYSSMRRAAGAPRSALP